MVSIVPQVGGRRLREARQGAGARPPCPASGRPPRSGRPPARTLPRRPRSSAAPIVVGGLIVVVLLVAALALVVLTRRDRGETAKAAPATSASHGSASAYRPEPTGIQEPSSYSDGSVGRLAAQLRARDLRTRTAAAQALTAMGPQASEAIPALLEAMAKPNVEIELSRALTRTLKAIGPAAVPNLVAALRTSGPRGRFQAAMALATLGPTAAGAVQPLIAALESDADSSVRTGAATALGSIGPSASAALPALRKAVGNPNEKLSGDPQRAELRVRAQMAIDQIKGILGR